MNRSDILLTSLGGGGNKLADTIMNMDTRYQGLFINTSITDLQSLDNCDANIKNYMCISTQNGVGRDRALGKSYAENYVMTIIEKIMNYVQQDVVYLISSLGGGSGSSILSVLLEKLSELKEEGSFDKIINLICIIPDLKSSTVILDNSLNTWSEVLRQNKCINSMIFIDNSVEIEGKTETEEKEIAINERFAELFDSIFDIPDNNGRNFDTGNLGNILKDRGCLYIYELPSGYNSMTEAFRYGEKNSVLAKVFKNEKNIFVNENGKSLLQCGYVGVSLADENYDKSMIRDNYMLRKEFYGGISDEKNLVLISGCLPPSDIMQIIKLELDERAKDNQFDDNSMFFTDFTSSMKPTTATTTNSNVGKNTNTSTSTNKTLKKVMKKSLFKK